MKRARIAAVATLVGISLAGPALLAQQAPEMRSVLAGRKVEQAFKGQAEVEFASSSTKSGDSVVTTMKVKNLSNGPIARLKVDETWFDKNQQPVGGSTGILEKMLEPGAVDTLTIRTPWKAGMNGNSWQFSHANGPVKPHKVAKIEEGKAAAAAATKAPAKKK
jgi:hypothetical protein